jgi:uncharacterized protein (DUF1800 family)
VTTSTTDPGASAPTERAAPPAETSVQRETEQTGNRRRAIQVGAAALAGLLVPSLAKAQGGARRKGPPTTSPLPGPPSATIKVDSIDPIAAWVSPEQRLVRRVTMGLSDAEATIAKQIGYNAYLERQLDASAIDDSAVEQFVATTYPNLSMDVNTLFNVDSGQLQNDLTNAMIYRSAFSARQLQERVVEFWTDHFNISFEKVGYLKAVDDRVVIRQNAMTTFPTLLRASAHSVAMLAYLDQTSSRASAPNQNYAREIMELHTLGVNGGYTQTDVAELSRVLTGWTTAGRGNFVFSPGLHDYGAKTVLGMNIPAAASSTGTAAQQEGEAILSMLAAHPSTATFISTKMLKFFLRYDPTDIQIAAIAAVYSSTQGDVKSMLRAILSLPNLLAAPAKFKRPYHLVVSGVRALGARVANPSQLMSQIIAAEHQPFTWQTPDGFPDRAPYWSGNMLPRWNYADFISRANTATQVQFDVTPFMTSATAAGVVANIDRFVFGGEMTQRLRDELTTYIAVAPTNATRVREGVSLALSSSTFQYY